MRRLFILTVFAVCCLLGTAQADMYVGASYLSTNAEFKTAFDDFDADDSSYKFYAGFKFARLFGIELTYRDLGTFSDQPEINRGGPPSFEGDLKGYDACLLGTVPLGKRLSIFAKAGYANISYDLSFSGLPDVDDDEWELIYGVGASFNLSANFGLRAEWEEYDVDGNLNSFSAGAFFNF